MSLPPAPAVLAASNWPSNGALIADLHRLGYLNDDDLVLDPTYGRGKWWTHWRPANLVASDLRATPHDGTAEVAAGVDFRFLPHDDGTFDVVTFDPPYVCVGGRQTSGLPDLHDRYGLTGAPTTPQALQSLIDDGLGECARVVRRGGLVLVKCADYITSGRLWPGTHRTLDAAFALDLELVDRLEHVARSPRPQPAGRRQVHARRNLSTLLVLRRPRRPSR